MIAITTNLLTYDLPPWASVLIALHIITMFINLLAYIAFRQIKYIPLWKGCIYILFGGVSWVWLTIDFLRKTRKKK